jgi:hypothetical protein
MHLPPQGALVEQAAFRTRTAVSDMGSGSMYSMVGFGMVYGNKKSGRSGRTFQAAALV